MILRENNSKLIAKEGGGSGRGVKKSAPSKHSESTSSSMKLNSEPLARRIASPNRDTTSSSRSEYNAMRKEKKVRISDSSQEEPTRNTREAKALNTRKATPINSSEPESEGSRYLKEAFQRTIDRRNNSR